MVIFRANHKLPQARRVTAIALFLALSLGASLPPPKSAAPPEPIDAAVAELIDEAISLAKAKAIPKGEPDYASRCTHDLSPESVSMALAKRHHDEPFVDAFVRWQLLSFKPELPEMDERVFAKFMDVTPRLMDNPCADQSVLDLFERAEKAGKLPPRDLERLRATWTELQERAKFIELMNRPAEEFREYVAQAVGENGLKPRLWLLENCVAVVQAGWSTRSVKTQITKSFTSAATDATIEKPQLGLLAEQTKKLADMKRKYISDLTVYADGRVNVSFSTAGVTDNDVDKWINRLAGVP